MSFYPKERDEVQISEHDPSEILDRLERLPDNPRYRTLSRQRQCQGCGIVGNRMFLEPILDQDGKTQYNLYAETKYKPESETVFVLMTLDHIIPARSGGSYDPGNLQTLCLPCNNYKDIIQQPFTTKIIRRSLPITQFIAKASFARNQTETNIKVHISEIAGLKSGNDKLEGFVSSAPFGTTWLDEVKEKVKTRRLKVSRLEHQVNHTLLQSQVTGIVFGDLLSYDECNVYISCRP